MLENRVVLVTGASRGIGAATARLLAKHGAAVAVNYVNNAAAAERVVQDIVSKDGRAIAVRADVRVRDEVESMVRIVGEQPGSIDTLILNAHIDTTLAPIINQSWEAFSRLLAPALGWRLPIRVDAHAQPPDLLPIRLYPL